VKSPSKPTQHLTINTKRLYADFQALANIGKTLTGGISRLALSNEDLEARAWFANQIEDAGLFVRDDEVGNLSGILFSANRDAKTLLIGSHLDTVPNGGAYDGAIGVLAGLEILRTLKEADVALPFHLEVINFTDEEGWWQSFFGSMGLAGLLDTEQQRNERQDNGAFRAALYRAGIRPAEVDRARRDPETLLGYLELHIEQGESLQQAQCDIGVVTRVVGRSTYTFTFYGEATHAATTIMDKRRDALQGAAVFITQMHGLTQDEFPDAFVNCGNVHVQPGTFNVVPSEVSLRVECRHEDEEALANFESRIVRLAQECAAQYRLSVSSQRIIHRDVALMDDRLTQRFVDMCEQAGYRYQKMVSFAGHDAQILSKITPSAMIFIPSHEGISHNPREFTEWRDIEKGTDLLLKTVLSLAETS
jgi:hydantoinase/carbamoylase family amidase